MASAHVDNRGSFGSKRSRNEGEKTWKCYSIESGVIQGARKQKKEQMTIASRNDGDWTCPKCANMNFGFRSVCNRSNCAEPRPPVTPSAPITSPYNYPPPYYFGGVGVPPVPIGLTSRYAPLVPLSPMGYNYSVPGSAHGPYSLLAPFPPATFGGMAYGSMPAVNGYGFSISGSPWVGAIPDNSASRKRRGGPDGLSEGDWTCPNCENVNFAFRTTCNMKKCAAPRPNSGPNTNSGVPEGSWTCSKCDNINFPFREVCNHKGCGNKKPASN